MPLIFVFAIIRHITLFVRSDTPLILLLFIICHYGFHYAISLFDAAAARQQCAMRCRYTRAAGSKVRQACEAQCSGASAEGAWKEARGVRRGA